MLTDHDQAYVNLTVSYENWMTDLAKAHPQLQAAPFSVLALPSTVAATISADICLRVADSGWDNAPLALAIAIA